LYYYYYYYYYSCCCYCVADVYIPPSSLTALVSILPTPFVRTFLWTAPKLHKDLSSSYRKCLTGLD